jgi:hypothetical protein
MFITIDTANLSDTDRELLRGLLGDDAPSDPPAASPSNQEEPTGASTPEQPARKTRVKKEAAPEELDKDLLDKAIARATELLKAKETALVKKALAAAGVERVSHLDSNEKIRIVLDELA